MLGLRAVARNTLFLSTAQILNPLTSVLLVSAIARMQGAEALGQYSLVLAIFYMALNLAGLGLNIPITRAVAINKDKASDFLVVSGAVGVVSAFLAMAVVRILVILLDYSPEITSACNLLMWAVYPSLIIFFCEAIFLAFQKAHYIAGISVAENVCKVAVGFALLAMGQTVFAIFTVILCLRFIACAVNLMLFQTSIGLILARFDWAVLKELRRVSPVFTANLLVGVLLGRIDLIILSKFSTMAQVGFYGAALRLVQLARIVPDNLLRAVLPAMSEMAQVGTDALKQLFLRSMRYMAIYGVGAALGIFLLAGFLIRLIYGDGLMGAVMPLQILAIMMIPVSLTPVLASLLFSRNLQFFDFTANGGRIVLLVILGLVLIPEWGSVGAATAMAVSASVLLFGLNAFVELKLFKVNMFHEVRWPVLAALLAFALSMFVRIVIAAPLVPIALLMYGALVIAFDPVVRKNVLNGALALRNCWGILLWKITRNHVQKKAE